MSLTIIHENKKKHRNFFLTSTIVRHFLRAWTFYCVNAYVKDALWIQLLQFEDLCEYVPDSGISNKHLSFFFSLTTFYLYAYILCVCMCILWKTDTLLSLSHSLLASSTTSLHCDVQCVCIPIILNDMQIYVSTHRLFCMQ